MHYVRTSLRQDLTDLIMVKLRSRTYDRKYMKQEDFPGSRYDA